MGLEITGHLYDDFYFYFSVMGELLQISNQQLIKNNHVWTIGYIYGCFHPMTSDPSFLAFGWDKKSKSRTQFAAVRPNFEPE